MISKVVIFSSPSSDLPEDPDDSEDKRFVILSETKDPKILHFACLPAGRPRMTFVFRPVRLEGRKNPLVCGINRKKGTTMKVVLLFVPPVVLVVMVVYWLADLAVDDQTRLMTDPAVVVVQAVLFASAVPALYATATAGTETTGWRSQLLLYLLAGLLAFGVFASFGIVTGIILGLGVVGLLDLAGETAGQYWLALLGVALAYYLLLCFAQHKITNQKVLVTIALVGSGCLGLAGLAIGN